MNIYVLNILAKRLFAKLNSIGLWKRENTYFLPNLSTFIIPHEHKKSTKFRQTKIQVFCACQQCKTLLTGTIP